MFKEYLIENSYLYENALLKADKRVRNFEKTKLNMDVGEAEKEVESIIQDYQDAINKALKSFESLLKKSTKRYNNVKILTDVNLVLFITILQLFYISIYKYI